METDQGVATEELRAIAAKMDDCILKDMIMNLPDRISKRDLLSKFDLLLPLLSERRKVWK